MNSKLQIITFFFDSPCRKTGDQVKFTILCRLLVRFPPGLTGLEFLGEWIGEECILLPKSLDEGPILNTLFNPQHKLDNCRYRDQC